MQNLKIVYIQCGADHSMALTESGQVYAWGYGEWGRIGNGRRGDKYQLIPFKVSGFDGEVDIISCGYAHSMALTKSGKAYCWGYNRFGQLGNRTFESESEPKQIIIRNESDCEDMIFIRICCGLHHSLLLSEEKDMYILGSLDFEEKRNGKQCTYYSSPTKIDYSNKFIKIVSHYNYGFLTALSINGVYHFWGYTDVQKIEKPKETEFQSFNQILEHNFEITFRAQRPFEIISGSKSTKGRKNKVKFSHDGRYDSDFQEIEEIGSGSFGQVFKAKHLMDQQIYAIKKMEYGSKSF